MIDYATLRWHARIENVVRLGKSLGLDLRPMPGECAAHFHRRAAKAVEHAAFMATFKAATKEKV